MTDAVAEPLVESAPLARRLAPQLCRIDVATRESCAWYHGFWQYARLLGLGTSPSLHATFLRESLSAGVFRFDPLRILIAGAADYSMLACVLAACETNGLHPSITMVDWCETPLMLSRWYAERASLPLRTLCTDLLELGEEAEYDLVCTHALLGHFRAEDRPALVGGWHRALRPGGRVVTLNRLRPGMSSDAARFTAAQVSDFCQAVRRGAETRREPLDVDKEELVHDAERYATRQISWPVRSLDELRALFANAGFAVEHLSAARLTPATASAAFNMPTVPSAAEYGRIVALKA